MLRRVLNLDPSPAGCSTGAFEGVVALDASLELGAEAVVEAGRVLSAGRSAMTSLVLSCGDIAKMIAGCISRPAGSLAMMS